jgi:hypothetical protein
VPNLFNHRKPFRYSQPQSGMKIEQSFSTPVFTRSTNQWETPAKITTMLAGRLRADDIEVPISWGRFTSSRVNISMGTSILAVVKIPSSSWSTASAAQ